jgi:hypothetical protein
MSILTMVLCSHNSVISVTSCLFFRTALSVAEFHRMGHALLNVLRIMSPEFDSDILISSTSKYLRSHIINIFWLSFSYKRSIVLKCVVSSLEALVYSLSINYFNSISFTWLANNLSQINLRVTWAFTSKYWVWGIYCVNEFLLRSLRLLNIIIWLVSVKSRVSVYVSDYFSCRALWLIRFIVLNFSSSIEHLSISCLVNSHIVSLLLILFVL